MGEDTDSGMESMAPGESLSTTPEVLKGDDLDDDEEIDETLFERLHGLTEMFPEGLRSLSYKLVSGTVGGISGLYKLSRSAAWAFFSTSAVLVVPLMFEVERAVMEESQRQQQRQIILGPSAAVSGLPSGMGVSPMSPAQPPAPR